MPPGSEAAADDSVLRSSAGLTQHRAMQSLLHRLVLAVCLTTYVCGQGQQAEDIADWSQHSCAGSLVSGFRLVLGASGCCA
jgi:hypothetical protein